jgi:hypothetical protein
LNDHHAGVSLPSLGFQEAFRNSPWNDHPESPRKYLTTEQRVFVSRSFRAGNYESRLGAIRRSKDASEKFGTLAFSGIVECPQGYLRKYFLRVDGAVHAIDPAEET